jgi:hypothetical protein
MKKQYSVCFTILGGVVVSAENENEAREIVQKKIDAGDIDDLIKNIGENLPQSIAIDTVQEEADE